MVPHHDPNDTSYQPEVEATCPDRPPQYKRSTCGFRCGWGCDEPSDDDGSSDGRSDTGTESTKVDVSVPEPATGQHSHDDLVSMETSQLSIVPMIGELGRRAVLHALSQTPDEVGRDWEGLVERLQSSSEHQTPGHGTPGLPEHGPNGLAIGQIRIGFMSPGPGIGDWDAPVVPQDHHFVNSPLRLNYQYQHCRGNPFFHMVGQDVASLMDFMDGA